jgi:hypothetical protein
MRLSSRILGSHTKHSHVIQASIQMVLRRIVLEQADDAHVDGGWHQYCSDEQANISNCSNGFAGKAISRSPLDGVSQDPDQLPVESDVDEPSMSFVSSFTSVFSGDSSSMKRLKHSLSPSSKSAESHPSKSRIGPRIDSQHTAGLDDTGSGH